MAKVDILLPYWGDVELLKIAINSVVGQTEHDWRLLIFDDCYPSKEPKSFISELGDDRIKYYRHKQNIGITKNFNFALRAAQAKYCVMLGCDDIMLPHYLELALVNIEDADLYQPRVDVIDERGNVYLPLGDRVKRILQPKKSGVLFGEGLAASLCHGNWLYFPSILWKTATIKRYGFKSNLKITQDVFLELSIIKDGGKLYYDTNTTFQYRRFAKSLSSEAKSTGVRFGEEEKVYKYFAEEFASIHWQHAARASKWHLTSRAHSLITH